MKKKTFGMMMCAFLLCTALASCREQTLSETEETGNIGETVVYHGDPIDTEASDPDTRETETPETALPVLRPEGFDLREICQTDTFVYTGRLNIPYYLYIPEGYSEEKTYPLIVYLYPRTDETSDSENLLAEAELLFEHPSSPAFESIVLITCCPVNMEKAWVSTIWDEDTLKTLNALTNHVNETYSTDSTRQYYVGSGLGADGVWQMMERYPERISAAVSAGGQRIHVIKYEDGTTAPVGISEKMAEIPICLAYDKEALQNGEAYCNAIRDELTAKGGEQILLKAVEQKESDSFLKFTSEDDLAVLSWLFSQQRGTGEKEKVILPQKEPILYTFFNSGDWFEYGEFTASNGITLPYRYYLPETYDESKEYPLVLFLHSHTLQGTNNESHIFSANPFFENENSPAYECVMVLPQCPPEMWWSGEPIDAVAELLVFLNTEFSLDSARQYVTGTSMGGYGTWNLTEKYPHLVSAAVPVVGGGVSFTYNEDGTTTPVPFNPEILNVPMYFVYDTEDETTTEIHSRSTVRVLQDYGAVGFRYKETNNLGHAAGGSYVTGNDLTILEWLFAQRRETAHGQ